MVNAITIQGRCGVSQPVPKLIRLTSVRVSALIFVTLTLSAGSLLLGCGQGGGGADLAPTIHSLGIIWSPLPSAPVSLALGPGNAWADCYPGSTVQLYGIDTVIPSTGSPLTSSATNMQWSTDKSNVATVSGGLVTCVGSGTATISANVPGDKCDSEGTPCRALAFVNVGTAKHTLTLSPSSVTLKSGQSQQMVATLTTETAPGVSTTQDVTASVFSTPENISLAVIGAGNTLPIDFGSSQSGNLVAQGSASALIWVTYPSDVAGYSYSSNIGTFTSQ